MKDEFRVVFITAANEQEALNIARSLVEESLAACVNIVTSCRSVYRWKGEVVADEEALLVVKAAARHFDALSKRVHELHSYDVPEVIAVDLADASVGYRRFLEDTLLARD